MKSSASPRRPVRKQVRLDLRRAAPPPPPEDEVSARRNRTFWTWFCVIAVLHVLVFIGLALFFHEKPAPPPEQFISLEPLGQTVHGTPGEQAAPKVGASTPAPAHHHHHSHPLIPVPQPPQPVTPPPPPPPPPQAVQPPAPVTPPPQPVVKDETAPPIPQKKPPKPKPAKPKIKVDLHLVELPAEPTLEKPAHKPKHLKKPVEMQDKADDNDRDSSTETDNMGLSKEEIAAKLGRKLETAGIAHSTAVGQSGSPDGQKNPFADFYQSIHDQVMDKWQEPNQDDLQATDPVVQIHVEADGRVPADMVTLKASSGNQAIDNSALNAARSIGYTLQPLPDGCPPDISINFKLTR